jgi:hypothetical protein
VSVINLLMALGLVVALAAAFALGWVGGFWQGRRSTRRRV